MIMNIFEVFQCSNGLIVKIIKLSWSYSSKQTHHSSSLILHFRTKTKVIKIKHSYQWKNNNFFRDSFLKRKQIIFKVEKLMMSRVCFFFWSTYIYLLHVSWHILLRVVWHNWRFISHKPFVNCIHFKFHWWQNVVLDAKYIVI